MPREISAEENKRLVALKKERYQELLREVGTPTNLVKILSKHCCIDRSVVFLWNKNGFVSKQGAIIVAMDKELGKKFSFRDLRPDVSDNTWEVVFAQVLWSERPFFVRKKIVPVPEEESIAIKEKLAELKAGALQEGGNSND